MRVLLLSLLFVVGLSAGCHHGGPCSGSHCDCFDSDYCDLDCGNQRGCIAACGSFESDCRTTCADDCTSSCSGGPNCQTDCGDHCDITCDRASNCSSVCGADCRYKCSNISNCAPRLGPNSEAICTSVANCNVRCDGACRVRCQSVGNCNASCPSNMTGTSCGDGWACGRSC